MCSLTGSLTLMRSTTVTTPLNLITDIPNCWKPWHHSHIRQRCWEAQQDNQDTWRMVHCFCHSKGSHLVCLYIKPKSFHSMKSSSLDKFQHSMTYVNTSRLSTLTVPYACTSPEAMSCHSSLMEVSQISSLDTYLPNLLLLVRGQAA